MKSIFIRFGIIAIWVFIFITGGNMAMAQQGNEVQDQAVSPPMSTVPPSDLSGSAVNRPKDPVESVVNQLHLKMYEVVAGDLSMCSNEENCLEFVKNFKSWVCAADACNETGGSKKPVACFEKISDNYSKDIQDQINSSFCYLIQSPSAETRKELLAHLPGVDESYLVQGEAYLLALKGSAISCENYIKNYVGEYGPQWNIQWYKALSGCRILAHETTREQEEKDFSIWFGVVKGTGKCSDIVNSQMRKACNAPQATSPFTGL